jgi:hypothetical protein
MKNKKSIKTDYFDVIDQDTPSCSSSHGACSSADASSCDSASLYSSSCESSSDSSDSHSDTINSDSKKGSESIKSKQPRDPTVKVDASKDGPKESKED